MPKAILHFDRPEPETTKTATYVVEKRTVELSIKTLW